MQDASRTHTTTGQVILPRIGHESPGRVPGSRQRIVMLVNNPCVNDSRVIKEAEALAATGKWVAVVCRWREGMPRHERIRDVEYCRIDTILKTPKNIIRMLLSQVGLSVSPVSLDRGEDVRKNLFRWLSAAFADIRSSIGRPKKWLVLLELYRIDSVPAQVVYRALKYLMLPAYVIYWALRRVRRLVYRALRRVRRSANRFLRASVKRIYWLTEFEDFGLAAERAAIGLNPDVVHAHDLGTLPTGGRVARKCGARLIYDSHELEMHRNATYPWYVWKRRRMLERRYIRKADAVITVSDSIADHLAADYGIRRPVVIVNAPNPPASSPRRQTLRQALGLSDQPLAVYVGSVTINRGIEQCVRALARIQNLHFALVGPRRPASEEEITLLAEHLGVRNRLHLVDPVPPEDVVGFVTGADVSVVPIQDVCLSYRYCLPNKLFESAFAGLPIAASNLPEMRRFIDRYGCGVTMDQTNPEDIAAKIQLLLSDPDRYRMNSAERADLISTYGWPVQVQKLCGLYEELNCVSPGEQEFLGPVPV